IEISGSIAPAHLAALVGLVDSGKISNSAAKEVFAAILETGEEPAAAVERLGLGQVSDTSQIERWIEEVIEEHAGPVAQYRGGKTQTIGFLVGQVMKRSGGRAEPKTVQRLMKEALEREAVTGLTTD
ncbi:MAG TPA: Asp-tRNA(Asn)/Glu-tRNA(Gln) amidotransferase GatCAB subunit B, partial [Thermoanaerobaculia bacterium]